MPRSRVQIERELTFLLAKEVGTVDMEKVIAMKKLPNGTSIITLNGKRLTDTQVSNLEKEAKMFKQLQIYSIITNTLKKQSELFMFEHAKDFDGMRGGKFLLHAISIIEGLVDACENPFVHVSPFDKKAILRDNLSK